MISRPFVSIIVPCFNEVNFIKQCLDSILANDYSKDRLDIIVVDGLKWSKSQGQTREKATGLPVFVSDLPLYRKIVYQPQCGICVPPDAPDAIATASEWLIRLYNNWMCVTQRREK